jgi:catechol 2,3-dioxygenase-like lactoylglutathione lyase family enzyme
MLADNDAVGTIAVHNLPEAKRFYEKALGLKPVRDDGPGVATYQVGHSALFVYESKFAGTNKATAVTWRVGDEFDSLVRDLGSKGVQFEHYDDMPNTRREGDVHVSGDRRMAWFKDPDGNIHSLINR